MPASRRLLAITACVVLLHGAALWALLAGVRREPALVVPVTLVAGASPAPRATSGAEQRTSEGPATRQPDMRSLQAPVQAPGASPPVPVAPPAALVSPAASLALPATAVTNASPAMGSATAGGSSPGHADAGLTGLAAPGSAAARIEWPSSDADSLQNPKPPYPPLSRRLGEQGQVVVRVLIGADGLPQRAQVHQSSGHERLDQAALSTVLKWRYVPGKRAGAPEAMWFNVPISFVLE